MKLETRLQSLEVQARTLLTATIASRNLDADTVVYIQPQVSRDFQIVRTRTSGICSPSHVCLPNTMNASKFQKPMHKKKPSCGSGGGVGKGSFQLTFPTNRTQNDG